MYQFTVNAALLLTLVAGALAIAFDYFPGVAKWFDGLSTAAKRGVNATGVTGFGLLIFAGQCFGLFSTNLVCTFFGFTQLLQIIFIALTVNQGLHLALKPTARFKARMFGKPVVHTIK